MTVQPATAPFLRPEELANFYRALDLLFTEADQAEVRSLVCSDPAGLELLSVVCGSFGHRLGITGDVGRIIGETASALSRLARLELGLHASSDFRTALTSQADALKSVRSDSVEKTLALEAYLSGRSAHPDLTLLEFYYGIYFILKALEASNGGFDIARELEMGTPLHAAEFL